MRAVSSPARRSFIACLLLAGAAPRLKAADEGVLQLEGRRLPRRLQLGGIELVLNGAGVRQVAWFKAFVAALYLPSRSSNVAEIVTMPGPKRLHMQLLTDVPAAELSKALRRGVERNHSPAQNAELGGAVQQLAQRIDALGTLKKGDALDLDWDPTRGLLLSLNGTLRSEAPAALEPAGPASKLYPAVLRAFIGERPYDERLKAGLLARPVATKIHSTTSPHGD
jgi:hypothetical protein